MAARDWRVEAVNPGYEEWRARYGGSVSNYRAWLRANGYSNAQQFADSLRAGGTLGDSQSGPNLGNIPTPNLGNIPVPGQSQPVTPPVGVSGPTQIPNGPPGYAPPQVQMPALLANPTPQGLGGMPMIRDRMMASTLAPFAQPNWGVPQVDPRFLTRQMPLTGGATPADIMIMSGSPMGLGGAGAPQLGYGLGGPKNNVRIPPPPKDPRAYR